MAALTVQKSDLDGLEVTYDAAAAGGDTFVNNGQTILHVKNAGGASIDVTVDSEQACDQGFDHDSVTSVPAGEERVIGPFPVRRFGTPAAVSYTAVTSVTVAAISQV